MIAESIKNYSDDEIISLINSIMTDEIYAEMSDLKMILAEASARKLEKKYVNVIADRIKRNLENSQEKPSQKRKTEAEKSVGDKEKTVEKKPKVTFDDVYKSDDFEDIEEDNEEKYPVLSFMVGLYKILAWILFIGTMLCGAVISLVMVKNNILVVCGIMLLAIVLSVLILLFMLSKSESIKLKIDIEKNLRKIISK